MKIFLIIFCFTCINVTFAQSHSKYNYHDELLEGSRIVQMFDSISQTKFFYSRLFNSDKSLKIDYLENEKDILEVTDSLLQSRIAEMNASSPFEYVFTPDVRSHIKFYLSKRGFLSRILGLTELYFPLFEEMLDKYDLPVELKYVTIIESALNPVARSRAGASGLWQFMLGTGKLYDLQVDSYTDDRFDPYKSTEAACRHFIDLYEIYGDWALCLAAYNAGSGRINRAIARANNVFDYWKIQHLLPRETQRYVPGFIAASYVFTYYKEHNIVPILPTALHAEIDTIHVRAELSFDVIAQSLDIPIEIIEFLNPTYKRKVIPAPRANAQIFRLPKNKLLQFDEKELEMYFMTYAKKYPVLLSNYTIVEEISESLQLELTVNPELIASNEFEDSLLTIQTITIETESDNTSATEEKSKKKFILNVDELLALVNSSELHQLQTIRATASSTVRNTGTSSTYHVVRSGESLGAIASKYGCSVNDLMRWNNLKTHTIHPNQKLVISDRASSQPSQQTTQNTTQSGGQTIHTVKSGESLWSISNKYGVSVDKIRQDNNLSGNNIRVGQKIKIQS